MYRSLISVTMTTLLIWGFASTGTALGQAAGAMSLEDLRQARRDLAHRQRRVIMNNDGCDVLYFPAGEKTTVEGLLADRTTPLAGTQVDAIAYCTISSGFSYFTHNTKAGTVLARPDTSSGSNRTRGTSPRN